MSTVTEVDIELDLSGTDDEMEQANSNLWLMGFGVGGCWSGYTDATFIDADSKETAMEAARNIAGQQTREERGFSRGYSYDVEPTGPDFKMTGIYLARFKHGARASANEEWRLGLTYSKNDAGNWVQGKR